MRRLLSVLCSLLIAAALLSGAIAVPLLIRPFYYAQIKPLGIPEACGLTAEAVREAYDEVLDYCLGRRSVFSAGVLPFSEEGASHFADVRSLFLLDLRVFGISAALLLLLALFARRRIHRFGGRAPGFYSACGLGGLFLLIAVPFALDFHGTFAVFHHIFFPGKDNWLLNPHDDPVILILPEQFFLRCGALILALLLLGCTALLVTGRRKRPR